MVRTRLRNRLCSPTLTMTRAKLVARPVKVMVPMMTPTSAQATPTLSAFLAPSARLSSESSKRLAAALDPPVGADHRRDQEQDRADAEPEKGRAGDADDDPEDDAHGDRPEAERDARAEDEDDGEREPDEPREQRREAGEQQIDQRRKRQDQIPVLADRGQSVGAVGLGHAVQMRAAGLEMHHPERGREIEQRRDDRRLDHLDIGDVERLGHDEGDGAHDRRHDLAAHAGGRLDRAREGRPIAEALHERDGELAGRDDVGDARAVDRAHERRGDDRHLGRPAAMMPDRAERDVGEQRIMPARSRKLPNRMNRKM